MTWLQERACAVAWWVLWRWWPDRVVHMHYGTGMLEELSVHSYSEWLASGDLNASDEFIVVKLDHSGSRIGRHTDPWKEQHAGAM